MMHVFGNLCILYRKRFSIYSDFTFLYKFNGPSLCSAKRIPTIPKVWLLLSLICLYFCPFCQKILLFNYIILLFSYDWCCMFIFRFITSCKKTHTFNGDGLCFLRVDYFFLSSAYTFVRFFEKIILFNYIHIYIYIYFFCFPITDVACLFFVS